LVGRDIGPEGASKLSEALIKNSTLHTLNISCIIHFIVEPESYFSFFLSSLLIFFHYITYIDNNIGPEGASKLSEALIKNSTLHTLNLYSIINPVYH
jgi:hypothetical protein